MLFQKFSALRFSGILSLSFSLLPSLSLGLSDAQGAPRWARSWALEVRLPGRASAHEAAFETWKLDFHFARTEAGKVAFVGNGGTGKAFGYTESFAQASDETIQVQLEEAKVALTLAVAPETGVLRLTEAHRVDEFRRRWDPSKAHAIALIEKNPDKAEPLLLGAEATLVGGTTPILDGSRPLGLGAFEKVTFRGPFLFAPCDGCEHSDQLFIRNDLPGELRGLQVNTASLSASDWAPFYEADCEGTFSPLLKDFLQLGLPLTFQGRLTAESRDYWYGNYYTAIEDEDAGIFIDAAGTVRLVDFLKQLPDGGRFQVEMKLPTPLGDRLEEILIYSAAQGEVRLNLETGKIETRR